MTTYMPKEKTLLCHTYTAKAEFQVLWYLKLSLKVIN